VLSLIISIVFPILCAHIILSFFLPRQFPRKYGTILNISLSVGLVLGISSCNFFLWLYFLGFPSTNYQVIENIFAVILIPIAFYTSKYQKVTGCNQETGSDFKIYLRVLSACALIIIVCFVVAFLLRSAINPHGWEDAWGMWNLKARFLFRGGDNWSKTFSNVLFWTSRDYPLLVPISIVRIWSYLKNDSAIVQILVAGLFTFSTVALLISSLSVIRSKSTGLLAGLVLVGSRYFIKTGAYQIADVPLGFYILSTIVLFSLKERSDSQSRCLILAGVMAGLAGWTKNEGVLFLLVVFIVRMIVISSNRGIKAYSKELAMFTIGVLPILAVLFLFKLKIPSTNELLTGQSMDTVFARLTDFTRYLIIGKSFIVFFYDKLAKEWLIVLPIYFFLLGKTKQHVNEESIKTAVLIVLFMLGGYFFIYLITPLNLAWHLKTSIWRLFLQIWPTIIFSFFLVVSTPEELFLKERTIAA
jgi:4-amino-4-deoxy-L-arabinose transferase-like glycosyltransferase